jgi:2-dehydropantoate 2-reductase
MTDCAGEVYDFIVICTKAFPESKPSLSEILEPSLRHRTDTAIVLAQNGINIEEDLSKAFPNNPILSGVVYCPAVQTAPGVIDYPEMLNLLELGTYPANAPPRHKAAATAFAKLMIQGGGGAEVWDDIQIPRWSKLLMNAAWNPVCALTLSTDGDFLLTSKPFAYDLIWAIMLEIIELAKAVGIPGITEDIAEQKLSISVKRSESGTGREMSMLQDITQGRPVEVEAIVGNTVRMGLHYGVAMPRLDTVYALLKARNEILIKERSAG